MTIPEQLLNSSSEQTDPFGRYAEPILQLLIDYPEVLGKVADAITPDLFPEFRFKVVAAAVIDLRKKHGGPPTRMMVAEWLKKALTRDDPQWEETLQMVEYPKLNSIELGAAQSNLKEFIRKRMLDQVYDDEVIDLSARDSTAFWLKLNEIVQDVADLNTAAEPDTFNWRDLVAANPERGPIVIDGLVREGHVMNIVSGSKTGKSWMVYGLAFSVITGRDWLGTFPTTKGKVLLIDNELSPSELAHRTKKVAECMGVNMEEYGDQLVVKCIKKRPQPLSQLRSFMERIEPGEYKVIVLDAMYKLLEPKASENDNADMSHFYATLSEYAEMTKAVIVTIHHTTKGDQSVKKITDVGSGASAQSRAPDCHLVLRDHKRDSEALVLDAVIRTFAPIEPVAIRFNWPLWERADDLDPLELSDGKTAKQQADDEVGMQQILEALAEKPATVSGLIGVGGMGKDRIKRLLPMMADELDRTPKKTGGKDTFVYSVKPPADGQADGRLTDQQPTSRQQASGRVGCPKGASQPTTTLPAEKQTTSTQPSQPSRLPPALESPRLSAAGGLPSAQDNVGGGDGELAGEAELDELLRQAAVIGECK